MKKLFLVFGVLIGLFVMVHPSYALTASNSSNKTLFQSALVAYPGAGVAPVSFITGTTNSNTTQNCTGGSGAAGIGSGYLLNCGGAPITAINISGGASGGTIAIYDVNTNQSIQSSPAEVGVAECVFEATVAASTQNYYDLHDAPINTQNGIVAVATSTSGVVVYSSNGVAANH